MFNIDYKSLWILVFEYADVGSFFVEKLLLNLRVTNTILYMFCIYDAFFGYFGLFFPFV